MIDDIAATRSTIADLPAKIELTRAGSDRLQQELTTLRDVQRPDLLNQILRATLFLDPGVGDHVAKTARYELGILDERITRLEAILERAQVAEGPPDTSSIAVGTEVTVLYEDGTEETLTVVGPLEADLSRGYVSSESPAGKALLGKATGDIVTVASGSQPVALKATSVGASRETA